MKKKDDIFACNSILFKIIMQMNDSIAVDYTFIVEGK